MKNTTLAEYIGGLKLTLESYIEAKIALTKAVMLEKTSKIGTYFFSVMVGIVIIGSGLLLLAFAFSYWYNDMYGQIYIGFLIASGVYLLIGMVVYALRRRIFSNNIIKNVGKVIFPDNNQE